MKNKTTPKIGQKFLWGEIVYIRIRKPRKANYNTKIWFSVRQVGAVGYFAQPGICPLDYDYKIVE